MNKKGLAFFNPEIRGGCPKLPRMLDRMGEMCYEIMGK